MNLRVVISNRQQELGSKICMAACLAEVFAGVAQQELCSKICMAVCQANSVKNTSAAIAPFAARRKGQATDEGKDQVAYGSTAVVTPLPGGGVSNRSCRVRLSLQIAVFLF